MPLNHFNTTPATHPELYRDGMYVGRCNQITPGQSMSPEVCARCLAVAAVTYGWSVGDIAIQVALTMRRKMGAAIFPDEEQAHGVAACAFAAEIRRRIVSTEGREDVLKLFNAAVEDEMPYHRYGYDGEISRTGGSLFCKFFGVAGDHIYSEYAAVYGDVFGSMMQRIRNLVSNMLPRVITDTTAQVNPQSCKPKIIKCPHCGRDVSSDSKTCWCCDAPISQHDAVKTPEGEMDAILREVSVDYGAYTRIPNELVNEYPFLMRHQSHEFALQVALTMILYAWMKFVVKTKHQDKYSQEMLRAIGQFVSTKYDGGQQMLQDVVQYQGDYVKKCVNECGGKFLLPYHLGGSESEDVVSSCERICFPYLHCLVMSTFGNEYNGSSANFFRHFIHRAESRYGVYRPLLEAYYDELKGDGRMTGKMLAESDRVNAAVEKSIRKSDNSNSCEPYRAENDSNKQGCLLPLVLLVGIVLALTGLAAAALY